MTDLPRRELLVTAGLGATALLAGCVDEGPEEEPEPDDDELEPDDDEAETPTPEEEEEAEEADENDGNGEFIDEEPDYGDWFDDVDNYEGTFDMRGEDEVTVQVGAGEEGFDFEPAAIAVSPGTNVVWEWTGEGGAHNVVHEDGDEFESDLADEEGHTFEHTFEAEGEFLYVCEPHENVGMKGAVVVMDDGEAEEEDDEVAEEEENDEVAEEEENDAGDGDDEAENDEDT